MHDLLQLLVDSADMENTVLNEVKPNCGWHTLNTSLSYPWGKEGLAYLHCALEALALAQMKRVEVIVCLL